MLKDLEASAAHLADADRRQGLVAILDRLRPLTRPSA
jgi:hypothetical protein